MDDAAKRRTTVHTVRVWLVSMMVALASVLWITPPSGSRDACLVGCACEEGSERDRLDDCDSGDHLGADDEEAPDCWFDCRDCACAAAPMLASTGSSRIPSCSSQDFAAGFVLRRRDPPAATPTGVFRPPRPLSLV